ncbi:hypothetical protein LSTR_LSTR000501 [Laodelphax striatellus]|uniref:SREBP regulating gene protein n=1 Tax=Laodelphax striatellus TaxID=195883 RepID=A0A482X286_LAOST|nr:hypothetical protein LSTR_LSTR000501 [Laodelphax striatellus]
MGLGHNLKIINKAELNYPCVDITSTRLDIKRSTSTKGDTVIERYSCKTCKENGCCTVYEHCVSCCLHPDKRALLQSMLGKAADTLHILLASVTDRFELCLAKCRTSSSSVEHENSYRDPNAKHCYDASLYKETYGITVKQQSAGSHKELHQSVAVNILDYFVYSKKEVRSCRREDEETSFFRVMNEVISIKEIYEIKYFDGIEIALVNYGYERGVKVTEIKYLQKEGDELILLGLSDSVKLDEDAKVPPVIPNLLRLHKSEPVNPYVPTKDVRFRTENVAVAISNKGKTLRIGASWKKRHNHPEDKTVYECIDQEDTFYSTEFKIKMIEDGVFHTLKPILNDKNNKFEYLSQKSWKCFDNQSIIIRVVNKLKVYGRVHEVETFDGVEIKEKPQIDGFKSVVITEKKYVDHLNRALIFEGNIFFKNGKNKCLRIHEANKARLFVSKFEEEIVSYHGTPTKLVFGESVQDWRQSENTLIGGRGQNVMNFTIIPQKMIGEGTSVAVCQINSNYPDKIFTIFEILNNKLKSLEAMKGPKDSVTFLKYFQNVVNEVWDCASETNCSTILHIPVGSLFLEEKHRTGSWKSGTEILSSADKPKELISSEILEIRYKVDRERRHGVTFIKQREVNRKYESIVIGSKWERIYGTKDTLITTKLVAIRDVNYYLNGNEIYKTDITSRQGLILLVGQRYEQTYNAVERIVCEPLHNKPTALKSIPNVDLLNVKTPVTMNKTTLSKYFEIDQKYWKCKDEDIEQIELLRVVSILKLRPGHSIAQVYHYDGVTIKVDDDVIIQETKYFYNHGNYPVIKYDGFLDVSNLILDKPKNEFFVNKRGESFREVEYSLDNNIILNVANPSRDRTATAILKIDSTWEKKFDNGNDSVIVSCLKKEDAGYSRIIGTDIFYFTNVGDETLFSWRKMENDVYSDLVEYAAQEVWHCMMNEEMVFHKVVNKLIIRNGFKAIRQIYYSAGVSVGTLVFPNKKIALQITQEKFFDPKTEKLLKYVGKLREMTKTDDVVQKLFSMPSKYKGDPRELLEPEQVKDFSQKKFWPLDTLRFFALRSKVDGENILNRINYSQKRFYTKIVNNGLRIFQIGTLWEEELIVINGGEFKCLLDQYNTSPEFTTRYIPKVVEYVDDKLYELDEDEFHYNFKILKTEVWICTNSLNKFIRVVTLFEVTKPAVYAIRYPDGVRVVICKSPSGIIDCVKIQEIVYVRAYDSKVLKYDRDLKIVSVEPNSIGSAIIKKAVSALGGLLQCVGYNSKK